MSKSKKKTPHKNIATRKEKFPHFRHYNKSGHPALILGEEKYDYHFRRVTSSEFSGHHRNEMVYPNPDKRKSTPMYIVKQRQKDKKVKFSRWKYSWKYPKK